MLTGGNTPNEEGLISNINFDYPYQYVTGGESWLLYPFWEYYEVTGDKTFLANQYYPLIRDMGDFYEDFLVKKDGNGKYILAGSISPENRPPNGVPLALNSVYDISGSVNAKLLRFAKEDYYYNSMATSHYNNHSVFATDVVNSVPTIMMEMLAATQPGTLEVLPALPKSLKKGSISGMLGKGQFTINQAAGVHRRHDVARHLHPIELVRRQRKNHRQRTGRIRPDAGHNAVRAMGLFTVRNGSLWLSRPTNPAGW